MSRAFITTKFLTLTAAVALATGVSLLSDLFVSTLTLGRRLAMHRMVLDGEALMPYQYDMYLMSVVSQWLQDHVGMLPVQSFSVTFSVSYLLLFVSLWACLSRLYRRPGPVLLGLFALAAYACMLMPNAADHPADALGAALIALTLAATARSSVIGIGLTSLAAGFVWSKHPFIAPIVLLYEVMHGRWGRGLALAALIGVAALIGPLCYHLPHNPVVPEGILTPLEWLQSIPQALVSHFGFALVPLLSLYLLRPQLHAVVRAGAWLYPLMIVVYAAVGFFIYELRSFWPVVPVFVALIAAWADPDVTGELSAPSAPSAPTLRPPAGSRGR